MEKAKRRPGILLVEIPNSLRYFYPLEAIVYLMYCDKISKDVNKCRFELFKMGNVPMISCHQRATVYCNIRSANYQAAIWLQALEAEMNISPITENGWRVVEGQLQVIWMTNPPAPDSILECTSCGCKTGCATQPYSCKKGALQCTDVCTCFGCTNVDENEEESDEEDDIGSDMNEDEIM